MELKRNHQLIIAVIIVLLIVPYGIETVPGCNRWLPSMVLLIVPYGIETAITRAKLNNLTLLIVPYGIETSTNYVGVVLPTYF